MAGKNRKYLYVWNYDRWRRNSNVKSEIFNHGQLDRNVVKMIVTTTDNLAEVAKIGAQNGYHCHFYCRSLS